MIPFSRTIPDGCYLTTTTYVPTLYIPVSHADHAIGRECEGHHYFPRALGINLSGVCLWPRHVPHPYRTVKYVRRPERKLQQSTTSDYYHRTRRCHSFHPTDGAAQEAEGKVV